jgi:protein-S-isoprenylcysteine O-methyltransferase Ste14
MKTKNAVRQGAIKYVIILMTQRAIGIVLFIAAAGTLHDFRGMTNIALYLVVSIIACAIMLFSRQETFSERGEKQENTKGWDRVILPIYVLLAYYGIYIVAGLGVRFEWSRFTIGWFYAGTVLYLLSSIFTVWPIMENKYFEETARIQSNREQTVISSGPYRIVRHPGYAGIVVWALASALMFGTLAVSAVALVIITAIVIRTYLEDRMLQRELDGYMEYAKRVRCRLIPFIW